MISHSTQTDTDGQQNKNQRSLTSLAHWPKDCGHELEQSTAGEMLSACLSIALMVV